jgi:tryptophanyl-tRNA synthetase
MGIKTDSKAMGDPLDPETCTVFTLFSLFASDAEKADLAEQYRSGKIGYGVAKKLLKAKVDAYFTPFRERRKELSSRPEIVESILQEGARRARAEAEATMSLVRAATGLRGDMPPRPQPGV